ncbi:MAG: substrate-binding domain-containing protein, partial [Clostridia bacterium]|nr:substrate-binding domain-containing protein [Clostridia bacterium]
IQNRVCAIINLALFACSEKYVAILDELNVYTVNIRKGNAGGVRISLNHDRAFDEICAYLKSKGRHKLVYLAALNEDLAHQDIRLGAYLDCVEKYGFVQDDRYVVFGDYPHERAFAVGYKSAKQLCDSDVEFDSVLCMNDSVAMGAMKLFLERGYKVPEDVCIIGCDNIIEGEYVTPSLSTIDVETKKQGEAYVRAVIEQDNFTMEEINARFVPRDSSV